MVNLTGVNTSSTSLLIQWLSPPFPDQNGIIRAYNISYGLTSQNRSTFTNDSTSGRMMVLDFLEKFTEYEVVVSAFTIASGPEESVVVQTSSDREFYMPSQTTDRNLH